MRDSNLWQSVIECSCVAHRNTDPDDHYGASYLCGADEACGDHFRNHVHQVLCLLYHVIDFREGGGFPDGGILHGELKLLDVSRHTVEILQEVFLVRSTWYLRPCNIVYKLTSSFVSQGKRVRVRSCNDFKVYE